MPNNILFVTEKWCDGNPHLSWTNSFHNLFRTFDSYRTTELYDTLHFDECAEVYGSHIDGVLPKYCEKYEPDILFISFLGNSPLNPSDDCLRKLQQRGHKIAVMWPDTAPGFVIDRITRLDFVDLHISIDHPVPLPGVEEFYKPLESVNHIYTWTPEDRSMYYPAEKFRDFCMACSIDGYLDRMDFLRGLQYSTIDCPVTGGQRRSKLSAEEYAEIIRETRMSVNFPLSLTRMFNQAKGRIFECAASNTMFFDSPNPATSFYFKPDEEYVTFSSFGEFEEKYHYYKKNPDEIERIANRALDKYNNNYTSNHWWRNVINGINHTPVN